MGDVDDMDLEMGLKDSQDVPAGRGTLALQRERLYAHLLARAMKRASAAFDHFDGSSASYARISELFDRIDRDVKAAVTAPVPLDDTTGLGNPRLSLSKSRKASRHKDCFEERPKKKARSGDTTSIIDVAN